MDQVTAGMVVQFGIGLGVGLVMAALYFQVWKIRQGRRIRADAVRRSRAVNAGQAYEQLVPWLPDFDFNPKDARFLGSPVDFIVFDGLDAGDVRRIVFVEVKTGRSDLSAREKMVRDAVRAGRIEWAERRA